MGDSTGHFSIAHKGISPDDSLIISYIGYKTGTVSVKDHSSYDNQQIALSPDEKLLSEITVVPYKFKKKKVGKKHGRALLKTCLSDTIKGDCFGYEFHSKKQKRPALYKVGLFFEEGNNQMSKMKFRVNVYDMSKVKKSFTKDFVNVLAEPIYFDYVLADEKHGKFEYYLPEAVILPQHAMVEIEFLENLNGEFLYFKSNLIGKSTWCRSLLDGYWNKNSFATPFFIECFEVKNQG